MTLAKGARQLVVQEALLATHRHTVSTLSFHHPCEGKKHTDDGMLPDDFHGGGIVFVLVNSHDEHGGIGRRSGHNHALSTALNVSL